MASCVRGGVSYRRHKVVNRMCARCGAIEVSDEKRKELIDDAVKQMKDAEFRSIVKVLAEQSESVEKVCDEYAGVAKNG